MARLARVVVPGHPHLITQRGTRRQKTFFRDDDYAAYLLLMGQWCSRWGVEVWAYCLMPDHVHLVAVPSTAEALARGIGEAHRRYARRINSRQGSPGRLWRGRFGSCAMDRDYLLEAVRYVETNPVRARLCREPRQYKWSSAAAHLAGRDDALVKVAPMLEIAADLDMDWEALLALELPTGTADRLRLHQRTGRPLGDQRFLIRLERRLHRPLRPRKPGPKPKQPKPQRRS